jgi:hypothetical protein
MSRTRLSEARLDVNLTLTQTDEFHAYPGWISTIARLSRWLRRCRLIGS